MSLRERMQVKAQAREDKANERFRRHDHAPVGKVLTFQFKPHEDVLRMRMVERYLKNGWVLDVQMKKKMIGQKQLFVLRKVGP